MKRTMTATSTGPIRKKLMPLDMLQKLRRKEWSAKWHLFIPVARQIVKFGARGGQLRGRLCEIGPGRGELIDLLKWLEPKLQIYAIEMPVGYIVDRYEGYRAISDAELEAKPAKIIRADARNSNELKNYFGTFDNVVLKQVLGTKEAGGLSILKTAKLLAKRNGKIFIQASAHELPPIPELKENIKGLGLRIIKWYEIAERTQILAVLQRIN